MADETKLPTPANTLSPFERTEDFESLYANNTQFETTLWDLKMIFGQVDQGSGAAVIQQHTAITVTWIQAKILSFFLQANIAYYETNNGKIVVPPALRPPQPESLPAEVQNDPQAKAVAEQLNKLHQEFFGER